MARFLTTAGVNYELEELIKGSTQLLVLVSPYLRFSSRIRELIEDRNRLKVDIRIVYGKGDLAPDVVSWLGSLDFVRVSYVENLHAKCYLGERAALVTSMNLYEFSQQNNNEMGIRVDRAEDSALYADVAAEVTRLVGIARQVRLTAETAPADPLPATSSPVTYAPSTGLLTSSKLAAARGIGTKDLYVLFAKEGWLVPAETSTGYKLTPAGEAAGGQLKKGPRGYYYLWPEGLGA